jgi:hypothetical protein
MQLGTFFTGFCISAAYHLKELWAKCLKTRVLTKKYVFKEKFKNIAAYYFSDLSNYMIYELIARILIKGEISRVLPSSLFSQRRHLVIASHVC